MSIRVQQLAVLLDFRDLLGPLADWIVQTEAQVKGLINLLDAAKVASVGKLSDKQLFFLRKRSNIGKALRILACIDDLTVQTIFDDKEAFKVRLDKSQVDIRMQDRGAVTNFAVDVRLHDMMLIDQLQTIHPGLRSEQPGQTQYRRPEGYLSFSQESEHAARFLLVHPSQEKHARPMLAVNLELSFLNQGFMEERVELASLRRTIEELMNGLERNDDAQGHKACR